MPKRVKTRKISSLPQIVILVALLIFLPLTVLAVKQKTNLLGQALTSLFSLPTNQSQQESFEAGFGGWEKGAWMPDRRAWSLERVQESPGVNPQPYDGQWEIAAYQDGRGDDGTIWLTKAFPAEPNSQYEVKLSFYLWSKAKSRVSWSVVAYGGLVKPEIKNSPDQWQFFETIGYTNEVAGWKQYSYRKTITTGPKNSAIWFAFGQHVLWEVRTTYFWDLVRVEINNLLPSPTPTPTSARYIGTLQKLEEASICQQGTHRLLSSGKNLIFLQSKTYNLDKYLGKRVEVSGHVTPLITCNGVLIDVTSLKLL